MSFLNVLTRYFYLAVPRMPLVRGAGRRKTYEYSYLYEGVAFSNLADLSAPVKYIQKWPYRRGAHEDKVPSSVVYEGDRLSSWGFSTEAPEEQGPNKVLREWFKTWLDPVQLQLHQQEEGERAPRSVLEVKRWYCDFLRSLYGQIESTLASTLGAPWTYAKIEFIFSVPTTWKPIPMVEDFRDVIEQAGFGKGGRDHSVSVGLTEAEAAAVHTSRDYSRIFNDGDNIMICDAGGGTTDLSVLKVTAAKGDALSLEQLDMVFGDHIGSAAIDYDFEKLVLSRLQIAHRAGTFPYSPEDVAWEMMKSRTFQNFKCEFGARDMNFPTFTIPMPNVDASYVDADAGIAQGKMRFTVDEFQSLFDVQVYELYRLIDDQLRRILQRRPTEQIDYLVVSGGLGNSDYIQSRLKLRYATDGATRHSNAKSMVILVAPEPQLAVCKGLVTDRVQKLKFGSSILGWRCCRISYGVECAELYDKNKHVGREVYTDPFNRKKYALKSIAWFVKKGKAVSADHPIEHKFFRKMPPGDPRRAWPSRVVMSHSENPENRMTPEVQVCCDIESNLSEADERSFIEKNKHFWNFGKHYKQINYSIKVIVGPADLRFELWFDGRKFSKDQAIKVDWAEAPPPPSTEPARFDSADIWTNGG
ncbi:MAG: hypothetical protein M1833_002927 [Piccolia ochrophora]|nr:MAG: hypothetical protein M1833_002927 [Piccolia ochrophora]